MPFDPKVTSKQECIITTFQDVYFVSDSFEEAKVKMRQVWLLWFKTQKGTETHLITVQWWICAHFREFAKTIKRPFTVRYNPYTQSVDVLKDTPSINSVVQELRHELDIIGDALCRLNKQLGVWPLIAQQPQSISACPVTPENLCTLLMHRPSSVQWMYPAFGKMFSCPYCIVYGVFNSQRHVSLAAISKLHKPKDL